MPDVKRLCFLIIINLTLFPTLISAQNFWEKVELNYSGAIRDVFIDDNKNVLVATEIGVLVKKHDKTEYELIEHEFGFNFIFAWSGTIFGSLGTDLFSINIDSLNYSEYGEIPWGVMSIHVTKSNSILFGTTMNIIKSDNLKQPWDTVSEYDDIGNVFDFTEDLDGNLYAATIHYVGGECGVFESVDRGNTWNHIGLGEKSTTCLATTKNNEVLAGSLMDLYGAGGVYQYNKEENNWENIWYSYVPVTSLVVDTNNVIYTGNNWNNSDTIGVRRSFDGGINWEEVNKGLEYPTEKLFLSNDSYIYNISQQNHLGKICGGLYRSVEPIYINIKQKQKNLDEILKIHPNPASSQITVTLNKTKISKITIFNATGRIIGSYPITNKNKLTINISNYQPGLYLAVFTNKNKQMYSTRFIKTIGSN